MKHCDVYLTEKEYHAIRSALRDAIRECRKDAKKSELDARLIGPYTKDLQDAMAALNVAWWHEEV